MHSQWSRKVPSITYHVYWTALHTLTFFCEAQVVTHVAMVMSELEKYFKTTLDPLDTLAAQTDLASLWWAGPGSQFPELAFYAMRVHAAPCVSSSLERFFSMMTNTQTKRRSSLEGERAGLFTAAHHRMVSDKESATGQEAILDFVKRMQSILESDEIPEIATDGIQDLETWLSSVTTNKACPIYYKEDLPATDSPEQNGEGEGEEIEPKLINAEEPSVLEDMNAETPEIEQATTRRSSRVRRPSMRYQKEFLIK